MVDIQVLDGNGNPVPDTTAPEGDFVHQWMAGRVPAAECPHYIAASEAQAGFKKCEHCS